jgi:hypothetical protein
VVVVRRGRPVEEVCYHPVLRVAGRGDAFPPVVVACAVRRLEGLVVAVLFRYPVLIRV